MRASLPYTSLLFLIAAACAAPRPQPASATRMVIPPLARVTYVAITEPISGARIGTVGRADSVAALVALYDRLASGWMEGGARSTEVAATFYQDAQPVAVLALAPAAFELRVGGRVLSRPARGDEALAFARLAGVPVLHGLR